MKGKKEENKDIKPSPQLSERPMPPTLLPLQLERYQFSDDLTHIFKKMIKYDPLTFYQISTNELKVCCEGELQKLQQLKAKDKNAKNRQIDNELSVIVISNHIHALVDLRRESEEILTKFGSSKNKKGQIDSDLTRENLIIRKYQGISGEIQKNEAEIRKFMDSLMTNREGINFVNCYKFFCGQIKKLKKQGQEKLILLRVNLMQTLTFFLREALKRWQPEGTQQLTQIEDETVANGERQILLQEGNKQNGQYPAHETLTFQQINKWARFSSKFLQDKMIELSGICQQIPQLEIFNRTLQFSQLTNREKVAFLRVVDVLISLHHRVSYLSRNKPQLMYELEIAQQQIIFINSCCLTFLSQMEQELSAEILPLSFDGFDQRKKSQLTESYIDLKHHLIKLSEIIISQDQFHTQLYDRISSIVNIVHLYSKVLLGESEGVEEWEQLIRTLHKQEQPFSDQERNLLILLERCIEEERKKINTFITQHGDNGLATKTNEQLEDEVNKLIEDYERLKGENKNLADNVEDLNRGRDELLLQIQERDIMIKNLSSIKFNLQKKLANQDAVSNHSNRNHQHQKKQEYESQKYLQSSLLLKEQLRISEVEKEKLLQLLEIQREKYLRVSETLTKIKPEKERLEIQIEALKDKIESIKNDHLRQINRLNKQIEEFINDKSLLELELDTAQRNQLKLMERLEISERKNGEYSKRIMLKLDEQGDSNQGYSELDIQRLKKELSSVKSELFFQEGECSTLREQNASLKLKLKDLKLSIQNNGEREEELRQMKIKIEKLTIRITNLCRQNDELVQKWEELQTRNITSTRRIKELEIREKDWDSEKEELINALAGKDRRIDDLQHKIKNIQDLLLKSQQKEFETEDLLRRERDQFAKKDKKPSYSPNQHDKREEETRYGRGCSTYTTPGRPISSKQDKGREDNYEQNYSLFLRADKEVQTTINNVSTQPNSEHKYDHFFDVKQYQRLLAEYNDLRTSANLRIEDLEKSLQQSQQARGIMEERIKRYQNEAERRNAYQPINQELKERQNQALSEQLRKSNEDRKALANQLRNRQQQLRLAQEQLINMEKEKNKWQNLTQNLKNTTQPLSWEIKTMKERAEKQRLNLIKLAELSKNATLEKDSLLKEINYLREELDAAKMKCVEMEKSKYNNQKTVDTYQTIIIEHQSLSREFIRVQSQLHQYQERYILLEQDNLNLQKQHTEQANATNSQLSYQLQEMRRKYLESQEANAQLTHLNEELQSQPPKIIEHYQREIKMVINEKDGVINNLIFQIDQLQQKKQNITVDKVTLKAEDQEKLSRWEERQIFITELIQQNQQLTQDNSLYVSKISQIQNDIQILILNNQQLLLENQHIKDQSINNFNQLQKIQQQSSLKYVQWQQIEVNLTIQITNLIRERDFIASQHQGIRLQLLEQTNKSVYLQEQINKLLIQVKNDNLQYYLEKIRVLEEAVQAIRAELNFCKGEIHRLEGQNYAVPQNSPIQVPQQIFAQNNKLKADLQTMMQNDNEWIQKQRYYLQELESMSNELIIFKEATYKKQLSEQPPITSSPRKSKVQTSTYNEKGVQEDFRNDFLSQQSSESLLNSIGYILEATRRWENSHFLHQLQNLGVPVEVCQQIEDIRNFLMALCDCSHTLRQEYIRSNNLLISNPSMDNLIEYVVRILCVFSQVNLISPESTSIRTEITNISCSYTGGLFFTALEEYTIHILESNAIEKYRRQLQIKSHQLQEAKENLQQAIAMKIRYEEQLSNYPIYSQRETHIHQEVSIISSQQPIPHSRQQSR